MTVVERLSGKDRQGANPGSSETRLRLWFQFGCLAGIVALAFLMPAGASGHGGEVHSEEPAPAVVEPDRGDGAAGAPARPKAWGATLESSARKEPGQEAVTRTSSEEPPAPQVPESNPTMHFLVLGIVAILGTGFILLRRRNASA